MAYQGNTYQGNAFQEIGVILQNAGTASVSQSDTLTPGYPSGLTSGDLILLQVSCLGMVEIPTTPTGFTALYSAETNGVHFRQWIYYKISDGTETGNLTITFDGSGFDKLSRMYSFRNNTTSSFNESGNFAYATRPIIDMQSVTTTGINELAVCFIVTYVTKTIASADDTSAYQNNAFQNSVFQQASGGDWIEPYSETSGVGLGTIGMQIAPIDTIGTISGGTATLSGNTPWGIRAFAIKSLINVSVNATGQQLTLAIGNETVTANANVVETGQALTLAQGNEIITANANISETGQALSLVQGNESVTANANVSETGQQLTFNFGSEIITGNANIAETGLVLSLAQGNEIVTANANIAETGQALVFAQGEESITADADVIETGLAITLAIGNESINSDISIQETGLALNLNQGNEIITADANISETGQALIVAQGEEVVTANADISEQGQALSLAIGNEIITADANIAETGLILSLAQGNETVTADANIAETGQALTVAQGEETIDIISGDATINITGQALLLDIGNETVTATSITQGKKKRRIQRKAVPVYAVKPKEIINQEIWLNGKDIKIASGKPVIRIDTSIKVKGAEIKNLFGLRDNIGITIDYSQRRKKEQREIMEYLLCA